MAELTHPVRSATPQHRTSTHASTARFKLPAEAFALAELFERVPDARVELDPAVANPDNHVLLVVRTDWRERAINAALRAAQSVATVERFGEHADGWTYRVAWEGCPHRLIQRLVAADVTLLSAQGRGGHWKLRLLAPDRDKITRAHEIMDELDCAADCQSISTFDGDSGRSELTDNQREALITAFETGYYNIPRDVAADELADELDISHQALSERFRRAYERLIASTLITDTNREG